MRPQRGRIKFTSSNASNILSRRDKLPVNKIHSRSFYFNLHDRCDPEGVESNSHHQTLEISYPEGINSPLIKIHSQSFYFNLHDRCDPRVVVSNSHHQMLGISYPEGINSPLIKFILDLFTKVNSQLSIWIVVLLSNTILTATEPIEFLYV
jgi:hypothetical protein